MFTAWSAAKDKVGTTKKEVRFSARHAVSALVAGGVAAFAVFETSYLKPETFVLDGATGLALGLGIAAASAGGATAGATLAFKVTTSRQKRKSDKLKLAEAKAVAK